MARSGASARPSKDMKGLEGGREGEMSHASKREAIFSALHK